MIYELARLLGGEAGPGLFQYISPRTVFAVLTAFVLSLWFGRLVIRQFQHIGVGEDVGKTDSATLAELHEGKKGTPTMGGLFICAGMLGSSLLWLRFDAYNAYSWLGILLIAWFGTVGFVDDWIKLRVKGRNGLSKSAKQISLTLGAVLIGLLLQHGAGLQQDEGGLKLAIPLLPDLSPALDGLWGIPFLLVCIAVLTGSANAVNLTDGLDGLAVGCVCIAALAYSVIVYVVGNKTAAGHLEVSHIPGCGELTVLLGALLGASLGFMWYNAHPAQVFMGDVGSLALGGALGFVALVSRTELVLFVVGGVFVAEALSVILQVWSFRTRGKRIFRCAPLHHHFQFGGMPETRLVIRIWIVAALLALASLVLFRVHG